MSDKYIKYDKRKRYRQDKRQLESNLRIAELKEIGDSPTKLRAYKVKYIFKVIKLITYATLTTIGMFYAPELVPKLIEKFFGGY